MQNVVLGIVAWLALNGCVLAALIVLARRTRPRGTLNSAGLASSLRSLVASDEKAPDSRTASAAVLNRP